MKFSSVISWAATIDIEEVADERAHELAVAAGGGLLDVIVQDGLDLLLGAVHLVVVQAEALHPLEFGVESLEAAEDVVFLQAHLAHDGVDVFIDELADAEGAGQVRAVGLRDDVGEALLHHQLDQHLEDVLHLAHDGGVVGLGRGLAVPDHLDGRGRGLGIGDHAHVRLGMVRNGKVFLRLRVLALGDDGEDLLDLRLGAVHVHVADHDDRLHVRMVPGCVEVVEALRLEGLQAFLLADEGAALHLGALEIDGKGGLHRAPLRIPALAALLDDDAALLVDLHGIIVDEVRVVAQDHQAGVHDGGALDGDVVEHVLGFLEAGGGVHVPAEFGADGTEIVQDSLVREMRGAVEAHMLQEVREAVLVGGFLDGAHVRGEIEFRPALRELVVADVVGESVVQMAHADRRIVGKGGHHLLHGLLLVLVLRLHRDDNQHRKEGDDNQKSLQSLHRF